MAGFTPSRVMTLPQSPVQAQPAPQSQTPSDLPPVLVSTKPGADESWIDGPLTLTFDQELDPSATDFATITPDLAGKFSVDGKNLIFTPSDTPQAGSVYTVRLDGAAKAASGARIGNSIEAKFTAATPLTVTSTEPSDGAKETNTDSQVVVVFNRPVVALSGIDDQAKLAQSAHHPT